MLKKIKEYFKGKNPYLMSSAAIVILSVVIISILLKDEMSAGKDADTATQQSWEESVEGIEQEQEFVETESSENLEVVTDIENSETAEIPEQEKTEVSKVEETEVSGEEETQKVQEEPVTKVPATPEPEPTSTPTPQIEVEESAVPEEVPEVQPEPSAPQEPEVPEETPIVEETPSPEPIPSPEVTPEPEPEPTPEVTPTPHEHSWIFESWYQEPTCSNGGLVNEICAHCGETQVTGGTPTGNHDLQVETPGDCCSQEVVVCTHCNYREVRETDPSNHIDVEDGFCYGCGKKTD